MLPVGTPPTTDHRESWTWLEQSTKTQNPVVGLDQLWFSSFLGGSKRSKNIKWVVSNQTNQTGKSWNHESHLAAPAQEKKQENTRKNLIYTSPTNNTNTTPLALLITTSCIVTFHYHFANVGIYTDEPKRLVKDGRN